MELNEELAVSDRMTRRALLGGGAAGLSALLAGCVSEGGARQVATATPPVGSEMSPDGFSPYYSGLYGEVRGERFAVPAVPLSKVDPAFLRRSISYASGEAPGTIVIDPKAHYLYFIEGGGKATRYGVGVGREGFAWAGTAVIHDKQEWPDWYPPKEMVLRQPELRKQLATLRGGTGMAGGPGNPLGVRAMYLWQNNKDTLYRIHGTVEPWTIGKSVSSGCIRMINQDVIDLYAKVPVNTKVVVLS